MPDLTFDYETARGVFKIGHGETVKQSTIKIRGGLLPERDELFRVGAFRFTGGAATAGDRLAVGTTLNDDTVRADGSPFAYRGTRRWARIGGGCRANPRPACSPLLVAPLALLLLARAPAPAGGIVAFRPASSVFDSERTRPCTESELRRR